MNTAVDISSEFNQVAEHDHRPGCVCVVCEQAVDARPMPSVTPRHVSPSILEYRIEQLEGAKARAEQDLRYERQEHEKTRADYHQLVGRVKGFERLVRSLSEFIDRSILNFKAANGQTPAEYLGLSDAEPKAAA